MHTSSVCCLLALLLAAAQHLTRAQHRTTRACGSKPTLGNFVIELDSARAPLTVANFLEYVRAGHYNGTIFHRVIANFVAQGGGYDEKNCREADPRRHSQRVRQRSVESSRHGRAWRAPATRTAATRSSTSISRDNAALDPQPSRWGYTVFGRVVEGMNVVDDIGAVATGEVGPFERDAPLKPIVVIQQIEEIK